MLPTIQTALLSFQYRLIQALINSHRLNTNGLTILVQRSATHTCYQRCYVHIRNKIPCLVERIVYCWVAFVRAGSDVGCSRLMLSVLIGEILGKIEFEIDT